MEVQSSRERIRSLARQAHARWVGDPVRFAHEALGVARIWDRQAELLRAVATHRKVAVRSGQKTSKTYSIALLAIWWAMTRPRSLVILLAPGQHHLETVLWPELQRLRQDSQDRSTTHADGSPRHTALMPLGGDFHLSPHTGWSFPNGSKIVGFVTNDPQRLRGISGHQNLYIIDEATAILDAIWQSIDGNLAGGGSVLAISNPVRPSGWFYSLFGDDSSWHRLQISSVEAAQISPPIPGLATLEFIEEKLRDWGEDSAEYKAKILGEFPPSTVDGVIPRELAQLAQSRWRQRPSPEDARQPLFIGCDPAHEGRYADKTAIVWRRGNWTSEPIIVSGCDTVEVTRVIIELVDKEARPGERPVVNIDGSSVGAGVVDQLKAYHSGRVEVHNLRAADNSPDPACSRLRDAIWMAVRKWMQESGSIARDQLLADDLCAPSLGYDEKLRFKVESKRELRKRIGRSTDRSDALALAVYNPPRPSNQFSIGTWGTRDNRRR